MIELGTKATLREMCLDSLLGKPVCIHLQNELAIGFFAGYDNKNVYLSYEKVSKPVTKRSFLRRLFSFDIKDIPVEEITDIVIYTHSTKYHIEKGF